MKKNYYRIIFEWKVTHTEKRFFRTGTSALCTRNRNRLEAINAAIDFAENIPSLAFEENGIDIKKRFMEGCQVKYTTQLTKIISVTCLNKEDVEWI